MSNHFHFLGLMWRWRWVRAMVLRMPLSPSLLGSSAGERASNSWAQEQGISGEAP